jgi:hypothetical protein
MPVSLELIRMRFSSGEKDPPLIEMISMNCFIEYASGFPLFPEQENKTTEIKISAA